MPMNTHIPDKIFTAEDYTIDEINILVQRWVTIPISIAVILVSPSLKGVDAELGGDSAAKKEILRWTIILSYHWGILAGLIKYKIGYWYSLWFASGISLISTLLLSIVPKDSDIPAIASIIHVLWAFGSSFASCLAIISGIKVSLKHFYERIGPTLITLLLAYYWWVNTLVKGIGESYYSFYSPPWILQGILQSIFLFLAGLAFTERTYSKKMKNVSNFLEHTGLNLFLIIVAITITVIFVMILIMQKWHYAFIVLLICWTINFSVVPFIVQYVLYQLTVKRILKYHSRKNYSLFKKDLIELFEEYSPLFICSSVVIAAGTVFEMESLSVTVAMEHVNNYDTRFYWIWNAISILGFGFVISKYIRRLDGHIYIAISSFLCFLGFFILFMYRLFGVFVYYAASILIGLSVGTWWVVSPQIILSEVKSNKFEIIWGVQLTLIGIFIFIFDVIFMLLNRTSTASNPKLISYYKSANAFILPFLLYCFILLASCVVMVIKFYRNHEMKLNIKNQDKKALLKPKPKPDDNNEDKKDGRDGHRPLYVPENGGAQNSRTGNNRAGNNRLQTSADSRGSNSYLRI